MSGVFSNWKVNEPRGLQGIINWPDPGSNQETPGAHNGSKDNTVIALPRRTKLASQNHGIVSRCQSALSDILAGCDEIASMLLLGYSWKGNLTQQQSSPTLVSNLQTRKLTPSLPQASILNMDHSHPNDPTLLPRHISTNPFYCDNSKTSTSSWYCSHVKAIRLLIEEATVIRVTIKQVDGYIFLHSTSSCLTARKKHVNEVTNSIKLTPSEPMGQEGLKAAVGSAREQVLAGTPQPSRLRTKDHRKLHKSGKGEGSESRNRVGIQCEHHRQDSSGASEASKRRERKNPICGSHGLTTSWLKNLLNRLRTERSQRPLSMTKSMLRWLVPIQGKKEESDSLFVRFMIDSYEGILRLLTHRLLPSNQLHDPVAWGPHISSDDHLKINGIVNLATFQKTPPLANLSTNPTGNILHKSHNKLLKVPGKCPSSTTHWQFEKTSPQKLREHHSRSSSDTRKTLPIQWEEDSQSQLACRCC